MPSIYDEVDVSLGWNGDLNNKAGDIADTKEDALLSLREQIHNVAASVFEDWEIYPNKGAGLDDFHGEPNTRVTADRLHDQMRLALVSSGLVAEEDLKIRVIPVHIHKVLVSIQVDAVPTAFNNLQVGELVQTAILYDSIEQEAFFLDQTPDLYQG